MTIDEAIEDSRENDGEQVAEWLEELKAIKEGIVFYSNRPIEDIVLEARADAIEECKTLFRKYLLTKEIDGLDKLLEELKGQKE